MSKKIALLLVIFEDSVLWVAGAIAGVLIWFWAQGEIDVWIAIVGVMPFLWRLISTVTMVYRSIYVSGLVTKIGKSKKGLKECTVEYRVFGNPREAVLSVQGQEYVVGAEVVVLVSNNLKRVRMVGSKSLFRSQE